VSALGLFITLVALGAIAAPFLVYWRQSRKKRREPPPGE
jgi:hypothetical protein